MTLRYQLKTPGCHSYTREPKRPSLRVRCRGIVSDTLMPSTTWRRSG